MYLQIATNTGVLSLIAFLALAGIVCHTKLYYICKN